MRNKLTFYKNIVAVLLIGAYSNLWAQNNSEKVSIIDYKVLEEQRILIKNLDYKALEGYNKLIKKANQLLKIEGFSVVNKVSVPPSGSKHDYMSIGPYWWPNPETSDGLPYIRKDGEINPEARNNFTDFIAIENFIETIKTLSNAYYYSGEKKYVDKNLELITTWFLNDDTKMNANVSYGQYIPGQSEGRCFGIIEFVRIIEVIKFLELAKDRDVLDKKTEEGMFIWFTQYSNWLKNSELGKEEATRDNNHGTYYDVQLLSILVYLNKIEEVKEYLSTITKDRIFSQIEPDGSQPLELARTKSFSYSTMNLHGFLELARLGQKVGVNLWDLASEDGRSIKKGYQYMLPYLMNEKKWEHQQIEDRKHSEEKLISDLKYACEIFNDKTFDKALQQFN
ncbi:alginate lyase family protein [Cellulophaga tyrosinoxydans]|uniref:Alginate lyase n=1 Tax=Cellulophaga tyrosinoxydans TaxID=504486 RepID=A0A1W2C4Y9_9FLAO|nr:alginate lyase family protein [Cellulophaga tyrosinoxydans]SMC80315.1 Alginate lyase [Cellulophaga tyrosinoxydans]